MMRKVGTLNKQHWPMIVRIVVAAAFIIVIALLLARVGRIPAASSGDEIWYSESAYWLLQEGTLRRDFHQDAIGSALRDFLPPAPALAQAAAFSIGGLNAFTIAIAPTATLIAIILTFTLLARSITRSITLATFFSFSVIFIPASLVMALQARFNIYVTLFVAAALFFATSRTVTFSSSGDNNRNDALALVLAGFFIQLSVLSYYQFAVCAALIGLAILLLPSPLGWPKRIACLAIGAAVPAALFGLWIGADFELFLHQNLAQGASYGLVHRLTNLVPSTATVLFEAGAAIFLTVLFALLAWRNTERSDLKPFIIAIAGASIATSVFALFFFPGLILVASTLTAFIGLLAFSITRRIGGSAFKLSAAVLFLMSASGIALTVSYSVIGIVDKNRNYGALARDIVSQSNLSGIVLIDQPAWLALRERLGPGKMIHITSGQPLLPPTMNASNILSTTDASKVSMIAVRPATFKDLKKTHTLVASFLNRDDVEGPIEVGPGFPNRMLIYRVRRNEASVRTPPP
jgi:hypothetical protein